MKSIITLAILAPLALLIAACDNGNGTKPEPEKCKCPAIESHFLDCVDYDCKTGKHQQTPRGYITDAVVPDLNVPIYQTAGISSEDAIAATNNIKTGFDGLAPGNKGALATANNFKEVRIVEGEEYGFDPATGVVRIGVGWNDEAVREIFKTFVIPELTQDP